MRDLVRFALRAQTILLAAHCRILRELDGSKIGRLQFLCSRGTSLAFDLASAHHGSYVRRHPVRSRASQSDSRNRGCKDESGVADGIYSPRSCGSADVAKEFAHTRLLFCEVSGPRFTTNPFNGPSSFPRSKINRQATRCVPSSILSPSLRGKEDHLPHQGVRLLRWRASSGLFASPFLKGEVRV